MSARVNYSQRARYLSVFEFTWAGALLIGAPATGWLISRTSWSAPFLVFALLPSKSRLFDIRYLIGALPAFLLIVALGIDTLVAQGHRLLARAWDAPWLRRVELRNAVLAAVMLVILGGSIDTYRTFRVTQVRCSQFYGTQEILERHDGFCRKHLILNSLYPAHAFIWNKHGQHGK